MTRISRLALTLSCAVFMSSPALAAEPDGRAATTSQSQKLLKLRARLENAIEKAIALKGGGGGSGASASKTLESKRQKQQK